LIISNVEPNNDAFAAVPGAFETDSNPLTITVVVGIRNRVHMAVNPRRGPPPGQTVPAPPELSCVMMGAACASGTKLIIATASVAAVKLNFLIFFLLSPVVGEPIDWYNNLIGLSLSSSI